MPAPVLSPEIERDIAAAHAAYPGVPAQLIRAIIIVESGGNPLAIRQEPGGEASRGLMQLLLSTARSLGYNGPPDGLFDPALNVKLGTAYLWRLYQRLGDWQAVISAYNGGIRPELGFGARVTRRVTVCLARDAKTGRCIRARTALPGEFGNQPYVDKVLKAMARSGGFQAPFWAFLPILGVVWAGKRSREHSSRL
jgi:soluble lytic murein transglycosylase-like protein